MLLRGMSGQIEVLWPSKCRAYAVAFLTSLVVSMGPSAKRRHLATATVLVTEVHAEDRAPIAYFPVKGDLLLDGDAI
jgi:hypothetical protein